jgi:hypothetical protein
MRYLLIILFLPFICLGQKTELTKTDISAFKVSYLEQSKPIKDLYKQQYKVIYVDAENVKDGDTIKSGLTIYYIECETCILIDVPVNFEDLFLKKQVVLIKNKDSLNLIKL